jgi:hypothetical protein
VLSVPFCFSCAACPVLLVPVCPSRPTCPGLPVPSVLLVPVCPSFSACPVLTNLFCLYSYGRPVMPCLFLPVQFCKKKSVYSACPVLPALSWLSYPGIPP